MAARKKQPTENGTPLATGRKKAAPAARKTSRASKAGKASKAPATTAGNGTKYKQDLVIVESPAKAKTINKYLGSHFKVLASYGHVRDLPRRRRPGEKVAGIDIEGGWVPTYVVVDRAEGHGKGASRRRTAKEILAELKREAAKSAHIYLATDPDREGEAIAWHVEDALGLDDDPRVFRITFNEITRTAVQNAIAHPGKIDMDRVHAQEARRILDRVVGYPLSNLLSKKVARRSSAGRVQSVALRLVVDREREIEAFVPTEYWKITALLAPTGTVAMTPKPFSVVLSRPRAQRRPTTRLRRSPRTVPSKRQPSRKCRPVPSWRNWPSGTARSSRSPTRRRRPPSPAFSISPVTASPSWSKRIATKSRKRRSRPAPCSSRRFCACVSTATAR